MNNLILTRPQVREKGLAILRQELGIRGFIEFFQDLGLNRGNYTEERHSWLTERTFDEVISKMEAFHEELGHEQLA